MPLRLIKHIARVAEETSDKIDSVTISGGEALVHPRIREIVAELRRVSKRITLSTNALRLSQKMAENLFNSGVTKFRIDLDPYRMTGRKWNPQGIVIDHIERVLEVAARTGAAVELNTVLAHYDAPQIAAILRFCEKHRVNIKIFERVLPGSDALYRAAPDTPLSLLEDALTDSFGKIEMHREPDSGDVNYLCPGFLLRYCEFLCGYSRCWFSGTRFDPDGHVSACMNRLSTGPHVSPDQSLEETVRVIAGSVAQGCILSTIQ
jgi:molybdenum cofactor biosynthesis enzyme MoaA